jgi:hypothetical protein
MTEALDPIGFLGQLHPLSEAIVERLRLILKKEEFKKKSFLLEEGHVKSEERNYMLRRQTAPEKIAYFQQHFGHLLARVPRKDIASYLGVTLETLSRLG